ncbi:MAG: pyrroline-5-carboxylate reductase, partial [Desulfuromonadaceae bacterium]|nr:pyrroline-5-carboxylate reductase [Desulfuromonadaceae bacterium]
MLNVRKIAFIGGGNMAEAIIRGLLREEVGVGICVAEINPARRDELMTRFPNVRIIGDAAEAAQWGEVVILAVKPQQADSALDLIEPVVTPEKLVISIMAGIPSPKIEANLAPGCRVIRAMPNTPALIGVGATAVCSGRKASADDLDLARQIFALTGIAVSVDEKLMDAVTGLSGSGPAYIFTFIEALSDAGVKNGLPRDVSTQLAAQTVLGAAPCPKPAICLHQSAGTADPGMHRRLDLQRLMGHGICVHGEQEPEQFFLYQCCGGHLPGHEHQRRGNQPGPESAESRAVAPLELD